MTRRKALATLGAAAITVRDARPQAAAEKDGGPKAGVAQGPRSTPMLCGYSQNLIKVPYPQLGFIAQQVGYEGVDLTVMDGGHVNPHITNVDLAERTISGPRQLRAAKACCSPQRMAVARARSRSFRRVTANSNC